MSQYDPSKQARNRFEETLKRLFPERQFLLRSGDNVRWIQVSTGRQVAISCICLAVFGWGLYSTEEFVAHRQIILTKDHHISNAYAAYETLADQVGEYRSRVAGITEGLEQSHANILALIEENRQLQKDIATLTDAGKPANSPELLALEEKLASVETEWRKAERQRTALKRGLQDELDGIAHEVATLTDRREWVAANIDAVEVEMRQVVLQRDLEIRKRIKWEKRSKELHENLADMRNTGEQVFSRFSDLTNRSIGEIEGMLEATGLSVKNLLDRSAKEQSAQGGPFIPVEYVDLQDQNLNTKLKSLNDLYDRWDGLQEVQRRLPLGEPLDHYALTSKFGIRRDPFNGRMSRHEGVDLGAPMRSPVLAVAPGTVLFSGYKPRYGKVVIIDHGMGFSTLYGHLHSTLVETGQTVDTRTKIARVGSSGRSTGPHLHYEVRMDKRPRNPIQFIRAGRHVFKG